MGEIEQNAKPYKVGKRVNSRAKVKNATKITEGDLTFDSKLEYNCYKLLEASGIKFIFKPEKLVLVPKFTTKVFDHTDENRKELAALKREWSPSEKYIKEQGMDKSQAKLYRAECKRMQSSIKRKFNIENRKVLVDKVILPVTWSPDFFLPDHDLYVESKGFANDSFPIKFKMARYQMLLGYHLEGFTNIGRYANAAEIGSKKELEDLIVYLNNKK